VLVCKKNEKFISLGAHVMKCAADDYAPSLWTKPMPFTEP